MPFLNTSGTGTGRSIGIARRDLTGDLGATSGPRWRRKCCAGNAANRGSRRAAANRGRRGPGYFALAAAFALVAGLEAAAVLAWAAAGMAAVGIAAGVAVAARKNPAHARRRQRGTDKQKQ